MASKKSAKPTLPTVADYKNEKVGKVVIPMSKVAKIKVKMK